MLTIAPSILSADFTKLGDEVALLEQRGLTVLHIDVMDGHFVPDISFGSPVIRSLRPHSNMRFDVHLMTENPDKYIPIYAEAGADSITVHAECATHLHRSLCHIKEHGKRACVALNPATPLGVLDYIYDDIDMVLIMTVNPGYGGQSYIPAMNDKIRRLKSIIDDKGLNIDIEVDGGISPSNICEVAAAGANVFVTGSGIFKGDISRNIDTFNAAISNYGRG